MRRTDDEGTRRLAFQCAWHLSLGMSVDEIAQATGRSRPTVYRALDLAREFGWLDDRPRLVMPFGEERDELEQYVTDLCKASKVKDVFGRDERPSEVIVVPAPPEGPEDHLAWAVCRTMRENEYYQEVRRNTPDPNWDELAAELTKEVQGAERVTLAGGTPEVVARLVRRYVQMPYTEREMERARRVGRAAAQRFCRAVQDGRVKSVGLSWGLHVYRFVRAVSFEFPAYAGTQRDGASSGVPNLKSLKIFPLIGSLGWDPLVDSWAEPASFGASANCVELASRAGAPPPVTLTQPAFIPLKFREPADMRRLWEYIQEDESVKLIFGPGLADRRVTETGEPVPDLAELAVQGQTMQPSGGYVAGADTLITGIGACSSESRAPRLGLLTLAELKELERVGATGDLSGQFFWDPAFPPDENGKQFIRRINSRVIGPRLSDFIALTQRAKREDNEQLGTVVLAAGRRKARAVASLCRWRAVNVLIIDSDLAARLTGEDKEDG